MSVFKTGTSQEGGDQGCLFFICCFQSVVKPSISFSVLPLGAAKVQNCLTQLQSLTHTYMYNLHRAVQPQSEANIFFLRVRLIMSLSVIRGLLSAGAEPLIPW